MIYSQRNLFGYQDRTTRPDVMSLFNLERLQTNKYRFNGYDTFMNYKYYQKPHNKSDMISKIKLDLGGQDKKIDISGATQTGSGIGRGQRGGYNPDAGGSELSGTIAKALIMLKAAQTIPRIYKSAPANALRNTYGKFMNNNPNWRPGFAGEVHMIDDRGVTYNYCGPNTNVAARVKRGDPPINQLDAACKRHDIAYATTKNKSDVRRADQTFLKEVSQSRGNRFRKKLVKGIFKAKMAGEDVGIVNPGKFANIEGTEKPAASSAILTGGRKKDPARQLRKKIRRMTKKKKIIPKKRKGSVMLKNKAMKAALQRLKNKMA